MPVLHVLIVRHVAAPELVAPHVAQHVAYLERHHESGTFLLSGPAVLEEHGGVIVAHGDRDEVERITREDAFVRAGVSTYEIVTINARRIHPALEDLLPGALVREVRR